MSPDGRIRRSVLAAALAGAFAALAVPAAALDAAVLDQSNVANTLLYSISSQVVAVDLEVPTGVRLDSLTVWLAEGTGTTPGVLEGFSGTLSWALYLDDGGPDLYPTFAGSDPDPEIVPVLAYANETFRVRLDLDVRGVVSGTYWLALHEGPWGSIYDGSEVFWRSAGSAVGATARIAGNEQSPGSWIVAGGDPAFAVEADAYHWNQSGVADEVGWGLATYAMAADFSVAATTLLSSVDAWIQDGQTNDDGIFATFDGTLSWALYADDSGSPGGLIFSGADANPLVLDTGLQTGGRDAFRVRIELAGRPEMAAGTYWLALHEGDWLSGPDGDAIYWCESTSTIGAGLFSTDATDPGTLWNSESADLAFLLFEDLVFGSGFETGTACAWNVSNGALCP
jgi:hypothetical protein